MSPQWALSANSFERLLAALHADRDQAALRYEELRERLVRVFLWEHTIDPETLADDALTRLARRLDEGEIINNIPAFLNGIARNVLKEENTRRQRLLPLTDVPAPPSQSEIERHHAALEACLATWQPDKRHLILAYYQGDQSARIQNRQRLAAQFGVDMNALRNRALRLRDRLESCVRKQIDRDTLPPGSHYEQQEKVMNDLFRQYMLTPLNDADRDQLRERLLGDQGLSDELREQENNWIDAYAAGRLPPEEAALLYRHLADTGQLHRVATAAALARPRSAKPQSIFPYAFGIAAIVVLCFGAFFLSNRQRPQIIANNTPVRTIELMPGTLRDGSPVPKVPVTAGMDTKLRLAYQDTDPKGTCRVSIRSAAGEAFDDSEAQCGESFHSHTIRYRLAPGRYTAELATVNGELIHTYLFDVTN